MIKNIVVDGRQVTYASLGEMDYDRLDRAITTYAADRLRQSANLRHWLVRLFEGQAPAHYILRFPSAEEAQAADARVADGDYSNQTFSTALLTTPGEVLCTECGWSGPGLTIEVVTVTLHKELREKLRTMPSEKRCPSCGAILRIGVAQWI